MHCIVSVCLLSLCVLSFLFLALGNSPGSVARTKAVVKDCEQIFNFSGNSHHHHGQNFFLRRSQMKAFQNMYSKAAHQEMIYIVVD